ncbi:MAG: hypothetical protein IT371_07455 [Deltaproteobacteria bacterium]|nr:hypothetical protein [Deltaproteobacteria bacterium]
MTMDSSAGSRRDELERVLRAVAGEPLVILITGHPDPDAIAGALAHWRICTALGVPATIAHVHPVSHRENRALLKLLGIQMRHLASGRDLEAFKHLSLVDSSFPEPSLDLPAGLKLLTVVDHHYGETKVEAAFCDVRRGYGTSSTIYAEYMQQGLAPLTGGRSEDKQVATALLFGIQTDTDDFATATAADFSAAAYLRPHCDRTVLEQVGRQMVSAVAMNVVSLALQNLVVVRNFALSGVGVVPVAHRDAIASAADYVLRREDIDTIIVYGIVGDRVDGSLRTNNPSVDPAVFLHTAFGKDRDGKPHGGGREEKGGFQIPLGLLADGTDHGLLWQLVRQAVHARLERVVPELRRSLPTESNGP